MRSVFATICILWFGLVSCTNSSQQSNPKPESKHSDAFNQSFGGIMNNYYALTEGFVNWDSVAINNQAKKLIVQLDSLKLDDLKKDTAANETALNKIASAKFDLETILKQGDITNKRHALNTLTVHIYDLLRTVKYDESALYLQECPMAFNEKDTGLWLSKSSDIRNPYMGLHHPHYGKAMIECGDTKDTLDLTSTK
jgi:hypothetical protein